MESARSLCSVLMTQFLLPSSTTNPDASQQQGNLTLMSSKARAKCFELLALASRHDRVCARTIASELEGFLDTVPLPGGGSSQGHAMMDMSQPTPSSAFMQRAPNGFVGLVNQGMTCYQNSVLQQMFMRKEVRSVVLSSRVLAPSSSHPTDMTELSLQFQRLFAYLDKSQVRFVDPKFFVRSSSALKLTDGHLAQNDTTEFYMKMMDLIHDHMLTKASDVDKFDQSMKSIMGSVKIRNCPHRHETSSTSLESYVNVTVRSGDTGTTFNSLDEALDHAFKPTNYDELECEACHPRSTDPSSSSASSSNSAPAEKKIYYPGKGCLGFWRFPKVLVVVLARFDLNLTTYEPVKLNHRVSFEKRIDLGRFSRNVRLASMKDETDVEIPSVFYNLKGILVHRGLSTNHGHYYSFVQDDATGKWFIFDDDQVAPFDYDKDVEEECFAGPVNHVSNLSRAPSKQEMKNYGAYMLFYTREGEDDHCYHEQPAQATSIPTRSPSTALPGQARSKGWAVFSGVAKSILAWRRVRRNAEASKKAALAAAMLEEEVFKENQRALRQSIAFAPDFLDFMRAVGATAAKGKKTQAETSESGETLALSRFTLKAALRVVMFTGGSSNHHPNHGSDSSSPSDHLRVWSKLCRSRWRKLGKSSLETQTRVANDVLASVARSDKNAWLESIMRVGNHASSVSLDASKEFKRLLSMLCAAADSRVVADLFKTLVSLSHANVSLVADRAMDANALKICFKPLVDVWTDLIEINDDLGSGEEGGGVSTGASRSGKGGELKHKARLDRERLSELAKEAGVLPLCVRLMKVTLDQCARWSDHLPMAASGGEQQSALNRLEIWDLHTPHEVLVPILQPIAQLISRLALPRLGLTSDSFHPIEDCAGSEHRVTDSDEVYHECAKQHGLKINDLINLLIKFTPGSACGLIRRLIRALPESVQSSTVTRLSQSLIQEISRCSTTAVTERRYPRRSVCFKKATVELTQGLRALLSWDDPDCMQRLRTCLEVLNSVAKDTLRTMLEEQNRQVVLSAPQASTAGDYELAKKANMDTLNHVLRRVVEVLVALDEESDAAHLILSQPSDASSTPSINVSWTTRILDTRSYEPFTLFCYLEAGVRDGGVHNQSLVSVSSTKRGGDKGVGALVRQSARLGQGVSMLTPLKTPPKLALVVSGASPKSVNGVYLFQGIVRRTHDRIDEVMYYRIETKDDEQQDDDDDEDENDEDEDDAELEVVVEGAANKRRKPRKRYVIKGMKAYSGGDNESQWQLGRIVAMRVTNHLHRHHHLQQQPQEEPSSPQQPAFSVVNKLVLAYQAFSNDRESGGSEPASSSSTSASAWYVPTRVRWQPVRDYARPNAFQIVRSTPPKITIRNPNNSEEFFEEEEEPWCVRSDPDEFP